MQGAGGVGGLLAVTEASASGTGTHFYAVSDGNGNVGSYLDESGAAVAHYEYDPFGNITVATGTKKDDFAHRFSTKYTDEESGLLYYGYRYYDPVTGRWPSRDPLGENWATKEYNEYAFVTNDALNWIDVLGFSKRRNIREIKAAVDAGKNARNATNKDGRERCGLVCRHRITGKTKTTSTIGTKRSCQPLDAPCAFCYKKVRAWHTHPNVGKRGEKFSNRDTDGDGIGDKGDIPFAEATGLPLHLNTAGGQNLSYDPATNNITSH